MLSLFKALQYCFVRSWCIIGPFFAENSIQELGEWIAHIIEKRLTFNTKLVQNSFGQGYDVLASQIVFTLLKGWLWHIVGDCPQ